MKTKHELRKEILQKREALILEERQMKSHKIAERVIAQKEFVEADKILLFSSYKSEVDTSEIFQAAQVAGKDIYYPRVIKKEMEFYKVTNEADLKEGYRGIREPEVNSDNQFRPAITDKICIIMPGAAFDELGNRIGYGGGYYDKYLQKLENVLEADDVSEKENVYKLAVAFECQLVEIGRIASDPHDIRANCIVTENKIFCSAHCSRMCAEQ